MREIEIGKKHKESEKKGVKAGESEEERKKEIEWEMDIKLEGEKE